MEQSQLGPAWGPFVQAPGNFGFGVTAPLPKSVIQGPSQSPYGPLQHVLAPGTSQSPGSTGASPQLHLNPEAEERSWHEPYGPPTVFGFPEEHKRFDVGDPAALQYFEKLGFVIYKSVLSFEEIAIAKDAFWDFIDSATNGQVSRHDALTWHEKWPSQADTGILSSEGIGQSAFLWYLRTRPNVLRVYTDLWGLASSEELIVSFDGAGAFRPPSVESTWRTQTGWFHTDQHGLTTGSDFACAQGFISLTDNNERTGGFAIVPRSHLRHADIFKRWPLRRPNDFFPLPRTDPLLTGEEGLRAQVLHPRCGDMVLWDSRALHCNVPARHPFDDIRMDTALATSTIGRDALSALLRRFTSVGQAASGGIEP